MTCGSCHKAARIGKSLIFEAVGIRCDAADARVRKCKTCDRSTWLTPLEWMTWLAEHGFTAWQPWRWPTFLAAIERIEPLPIHPPGPKKKLYCSLCKCPVSRKSALTESTCPLGKWDR